MTDLEKVMLAALRAQHEAIDRLMAQIITLDKTFMPSKSPEWQALTLGNAVIKATEKLE